MTPDNDDRAKVLEMLRQWRRERGATMKTLIGVTLTEDAVLDAVEAALSPSTDNAGEYRGPFRRLDDGPELPRDVVNGYKKQQVIKAFQEGLSARACGRVFDISHETAAQWTKGVQATPPPPPPPPPRLIREGVEIINPAGDKNGRR